MQASAHSGGGRALPPNGRELAAQNAQLRGNLRDALHAISQLLEAQGRAGMVDGDLADAVAFARAEHAWIKSEMAAVKCVGGAR